MKFSKNYAIFTEPYMYITMNLENMAQAVKKIDNFTLGIYSFDWIYALSGLKHWMANYFHLNAREFLTSSYTTYPFHWYYYLDFGLIGVMIFPLLVGFFVGIIYYKLKSSAQLKWIVLYSICVAIMVISFFTNPLMMLTFVTNFFILWVVHNHFITKLT
jgi:oligosaccharide repeat unit polymerase